MKTGTGGQEDITNAAAGLIAAGCGRRRHPFPSSPVFPTPARPARRLAAARATLKYRQKYNVGAFLCAGHRMHGSLCMHHWCLDAVLVAGRRLQ